MWLNESRTRFPVMRTWERAGNQVTSGSRNNKIQGLSELDRLGKLVYNLTNLSIFDSLMISLLLIWFIYYLLDSLICPCAWLKTHDLPAKHSSLWICSSLSPNKSTKYIFRPSNWKHQSTKQNKNPLQQSETKIYVTQTKFSISN